MDFVSRTLRHGNRVQVTGQLLTDGPSLRLAPVWTDPSGQNEALESVAVDLTGLQGTRPDAGVSVAGTWNGSAIEAATIEPVALDLASFRLRPSQREQLEIELPILDAPVTPVDSDAHDDAIRSLIDTGAVLHDVRVRAGNGVAAVVSAVDVAQVELALRPLLQDALVVVPSPWSRSDLDTIQQILSEEEEPAGVFMSGEGMDPRARYRVTAWVRQITPRLAERLAPCPEGIVALEVWLEPTQAVA
ncbi:hypothetical protein HQQ81_13415 [Microbacteriaceae bacterium VKM Ac-2854]|nr:hypothetical protein [Microbacteriaceae bacterium VKM Ac-2854]